MNDLIGKDENNISCLHNLPNRNVEYHADFLLEISLSCLDPKFQKRKEKLWTYIYPNNTKVHLDYIFINNKWMNTSVVGLINIPITQTFEI